MDRENLLPNIKMFAAYLTMAYLLVLVVNSVIMPMMISISQQAQLVNWQFLTKIIITAITFIVVSAFLFTATLRQCRKIAGS